MKAAGSGLAGTAKGHTRASKASTSGEFQHTVQPQAHTELRPGLQSESNPQPPSASIEQTPLMNPGALSAQAVVALGPSGNLTASQRGELELAKARAERAAASRKTTGASGSNAAGRSSSAKRGRGGPSANHNNHSDDDDEDYVASDGELELAKLSPEEQERIITAKLASGTTTDKDARRLKRLLRNRVSAQQARERKKQYVTSLEEQIREQQAVIGVLEKRVKDLESQNEALRNIIRTMRPFRDPAPGAAGAGAGAGAGGATAPGPVPGAQAGGGGAAARPAGAGQGQGQGQEQQLTPQQQQAMRARALALMQRRQAAAAAAEAAGAAEARGGAGQQQLLQEAPPSAQQQQQQHLLLQSTVHGPHQLQAPHPQPQPHEQHRQSIDESGSDTGHNAGSGTGGPKHFVPASPTAVDSLQQYHNHHHQQHYQFRQQAGQQQHHMQLPAHSQGQAVETHGPGLGGGDDQQMLDVQLGSSPLTSYGAVPFYGTPTLDIDLGDAAVVPPGPADGL